MKMTIEIDEADHLSRKFSLVPVFLRVVQRFFITATFFSIYLCFSEAAVGQQSAMLFSSFFCHRQEKVLRSFSALQVVDPPKGKKFIVKVALMTGKLP